MILRGILDSSLNGQLCIRGFAPIKQLARYSKADYSYQRNLLAEQQEETYRHQILHNAIGALTPRERQIFIARRLTDDPLKLEQLASEYGISRERVRQIEQRAFEKVKAAMLTNGPARGLN